MSFQASQLREEWRSMLSYGVKEWKSLFSNWHLQNDLISGLTVAAVALPLNIALALAAGLPAEAGIFSGVIGGFLAAVFGGSALQVTGPAAALNLMVFQIVKDFGPMGAAAAAIIVGIIEVALGVMLLGKWMKFLPETVLAGFTTGVGIKLLDGQIPIFLGIEKETHELVSSLANPTWLHHVNWSSVVVGISVVVMMLALVKYKKIPAGLLGIALATVLSVYLNWDLSRVGSIPAEFPSFNIPVFSSSQWLNLVALAIPLGILAGAESLLSAQGIDRMKKGKLPHHSNMELMGQGIANLGVGLFSGMPVSGVIVRSSVNVQSGAETRFSSVFHCVFLLISCLYLGLWIEKIPLAALAGLLCVVGMRLVELHTFFHLLARERLQSIAFGVVCFGTLSGHLMSGLMIGMVISFIPQIFQAAFGGGLTLLKRRHSISEYNSEGVPVRFNKAYQVFANKQVSDASLKLGAIQGSTEKQQWKRHIAEQPLVSTSAFIHPRATVIGKVVIDEKVHVAAEASIRADEGSPFFIGAKTNLQDGVVLHALKNQWVSVNGVHWAIYMGERISAAHQALIHGPCEIGDDTFIGFKAVIHKSKVGRNCFIGIGAVVVGVEIPDNRAVPNGMVVDKQEQVSQLPQATSLQHHFNEDVVEVNEGLIEAYQSNYSVKRSQIWQSKFSPQSLEF